MECYQSSQSPEDGGYFTPGLAYGVYLQGGYAYIADGDCGLRIIDVSNPASPFEVGFWETPGEARGVWVWGSYAYVANGEAGLRVIDVSDPANPLPVGFYDTPGYGCGVYARGNYAYIADGGCGLQIYQFYGPGVREEKNNLSSFGIRVLNNPVRGRIELSFGRPQGRVMVGVYNPLGQRVRTYSFGKVQDKVSLSTQGLAEGIYFLKIAGESFNSCVKVQLVK